jgi:ribosomal protein S18 acetylase RimI-like enzyme
MSLVIRNADHADASDFSSLVLLSGPSFLPAVFGPDTAEVLSSLFRQDGNLFSYELARLAVVNGKNAGVLLGYTGHQKDKVALHTGRLLIEYFRTRFFSVVRNLLKAAMVLTSPGKGDFYVASIAVYPEFRGRGVATALLLDAERRAQKAKAHRLVLDVEAGNSPAVNLYRKIGFREEGHARSVQIRGTKFEFLKMVKSVNL